jgi:PIN domain nuclease of toxin-antitoxin system
MGGDPLAATGEAALIAARSTRSGIYVSPFSAWEIGTLLAKGKLRIPLPPELWFESLLALPGVRLARLTPGILLSSTSLPGTPPNDPSDRIMAATARIHGYKLITRDRLLLDYAKQGYMQATEC